VLLRDESTIVLSLLDRCEDVEIVKNIAKEIEESTASIHKSVYDRCLSFYSEHGRFPDFGFIVKNSPEINFGAKYSGEYSSDIIVQFLTELRKESARNKAQEFLLQDEFEKASEACSYAVSLEKDLSIYGVDDALAEYNALKGQPNGIYSGINQIDDVVNAFAYGNLTVIGAPPACFKTTLAQNIAYYAISKGFRVAFISLELLKRNIYNNMLSRHSAFMGIPFSAEHAHKRTLEGNNEYDAYVKVCEDFKERELDKKLVVLSSDDIVSWERSYLTRFLEQIDERVGGLDVVFLDYIQLCRGFAPEKSDSTVFVNNLITHLSLLTKHFKGRGLITFILSQINREGMKNMEKSEGEKGMCLSSLAEFNALEREAHVVTLLYANDADKNARVLKLKVAKNRTGRTHTEPETVLIEPSTGVIGKHRFEDILNVESLITTFSGDGIGSLEEVDDDAIF